ncbi:MAG: xanthine dehydrogenase family protein molybdopterin-binding subunit [Armatimonadota bacterium]|nr:xanthine dehydrogenase family protein molybdopterin-binding subunit [Armatimonadota bacterium]MDR5698070.1 xanthine dehydrogenase family protein molybdopterin-binding subunit [Armatimonadota bacterium]
MTAGITRHEDPRLLSGRARYLDDIRLPGALHAAFVRSPHAHARILRVRRAAEWVWTYEDLEGVHPIAPRLDADGFTPTAQWPLAADRVRYVGEPVAVVVAADRYEAEDLAERVEVDYDPLPTVADAETALRPDAPRLHDAASNILYHRSHHGGDPEAVFRHAPVTVCIDVRSARCAASPMEGRGILAAYEGQMLHVWIGTQVPALIRSALAACLGLPEHRIRLLVPDTGGGFGQKMHLYPEDVVVCWLAARLGRPVKWVEDRRENLTAATQAREERVEVEVAATTEGRVLGLRGRVVGDVGAYHVFPTTAALEPLGAAQILPGPYAVDHYAYEVLAVCTNKPPTGAYRGVGMTVGAFAMERAMDCLAREVGLDAVEVRRRNLISPDAFPYQSASGLTYDGGSFHQALQRLCEATDYERLRADQQRERTRSGRLLGIGVACYTEYTGMGSATFARRGMTDIPGHEAAAVRVDPSGSVRVSLSFTSQGQGHETTMAQIVAEVLQVPADRIQVEPFDSRASPHGSGTFGSRTSVAGAGAVYGAALRVRERALAIASSLLEAAVSDLEWEGGRIRVRGSLSRSVTFDEVARAAYKIPLGKAGTLQPGLEAVEYFDPPPATFSNAAHLAVVEVDPHTGALRPLRYVVVEDCGRVLNARIVRGQIHGAIAQGLGEAVLEHAVYGPDGQPLASTFMDYLLPLATDMPDGIEILHLENPSDRPGGMKGMAEGGAIGAPAAIANAVSDAVGAQVQRIPLTPEYVLALLDHSGRRQT